MFTLTHSIQPAITLSTCSEISFPDRTLNLRSYNKHHLTLALSAINFTYEPNIFHHMTQQSLPNGILKASVPAASCLSLLSCACYTLFT